MKKKKTGVVEKDNKVNKPSKLNILFIYLQIILTIVTVVMAIMFLFNRKLNNIFQIFLGLDLLVMAYNNHRMYKRRGLTIVYILVGIILLVLSLLMILGV